MADPKIYQGKTSVKIKDLNPDDTWLGSDPHSSQPFDSDRNDALIRGLDTPDIRPRGMPLHQREEPDNTKSYNRGGKIEKHGSSTCVHSSYPHHNKKA
jgi:hypothetical protein